MSEGEGSAPRAAFNISLAVAAVLAAFAAAFVPYLPTNDGPQHVLSGVLQLGYSQPGAPYQRLLEPLPEFAERGFSTLFVPLLEVLSWRTALRVVLAVSAVTGGASFAWLACSLAKRRTPVALLGFAIAFPWTLYMGFFSFTLAMNGAVALIAYAVSREKLGLRQHLVISACLLVLAVMHVVAAIFAVGVLLLVGLFRSRQAGVSMVAASAPVWLMVVVVVVTSPKTPSTVAAAWAPAGEWAHAFSECLLPGPAPRALACVCIVVLSLVLAGRRVRAGVASPDEKALLACSVVLLSAALFGPRDLPEWQLVGPRLCSVAAPLALALLGTTHLSSSLRELGIAGALTAASLATTIPFHLRLARACESAFAGLDAPIELRGFTLPLPLDMYCGVQRDARTSEVPYLSPLFHVGALYAAARGGLTPYMLSGTPAVHAFRFRADVALPPKPDDRTYLALQGLTADDPRRPAAIARFAERGAFFEHLLVVGATRLELEDVKQRGFVSEWSNDSAMLARFEACAIELVFDSPGPRRVVVQTGGRPADASIGEQTFDARAGVDRTELRGVGCGPQWVRPYVDVDRSGAPTKGDLFCAGADGDGRLAVDIVRAATVTCRLR